MTKTNIIIMIIIIISMTFALKEGMSDSPQLGAVPTTKRWSCVGLFLVVISACWITNDDTSVGDD